MLSWVEHKKPRGLFLFAVWSGPIPFAKESLDYTECMNEDQRPGWYFAYAQEDLNPSISRMLERAFLLDVARLGCLETY